MQTNDLPRIGVLSADPAAVTQFLRRVQALGADPAALLPLSPAAVPDCEPYLCGASTQPPLPQLRAAAEMLFSSATAQKYSSCLSFIACPPCHTFAVWYTDKLSTFHYSTSLL